MLEKKIKNKKIEHVSMVDQVYDSIKSEIVEGRWKTNKKLPSESDLAELYGVNRMTIRMALQKLNTIGIVETKIGKGSFVRDFSLIFFLKEISDLYLNKDKLEEIFEMRKLIEIESARLTILNATPNDLKKLKDALDKYLSQKQAFRNLPNDSTLDKLVDADMNFHYQICNSSHNSLYKDLFYLTNAITKKYITQLITYRDNQWKNKTPSYNDFDEHILLYEAICNKDNEACTKIYLEIINYKKEI